MRYPERAMETIAPPAAAAAPATPERSDEKTLEAYRRLGFLQADLDPMHRLPPDARPILDGADPATAEQARRWYCGTIGVEFMHIPEGERRDWIQARIEAEPPRVDQERI